MNSRDSFLRRTGRALRTLALGIFPLIMLLALAMQATHQESAASPILAPESASTPQPAAYREVQFNFGRGYIGAGWQLYFTEPDASADRERYQGGIETALVEAIDNTRESLDIAVFELNSAPIYRAILAAHQRGVALRIVADDDHGLHDGKNEALRLLQAAGIPIVDDGRSGLMHNKFMILDRRTVWTGSWNYTVNGAYRNNNNALVFDSAPAVLAYQAEFDEMFEKREFGVSSTDGVIDAFTHMDGEVSVIFAPEADEVAALSAAIAQAQRSIHFMTFVFSLEELAETMLLQSAKQGLALRGIFERRNSIASWSQLPALHCAGAEMRQDGNPYTLHHKVIIIDQETVITGSFNFSNNAAKSNDENILIIRDATIAGLYLDEWRRLWDSATELAPGAVACD